MVTRRKTYEGDKVNMVIRKTRKPKNAKPGWKASHEYDFRLLGRRHRKGRFKTSAEAAAAERLEREKLLSGKSTMTFRAAYDEYMLSIKKKAITTQEDYATFMERTIAPKLAHLLLDEVTTHEIDKLKQAMPAKWGPKSINQRLILVRAVLRFAWKRGWLRSPPFVPMETVPTKHIEWYQVDERDQLHQGFFDHQPQWYFFYYLASRCGLRVGEMYPIEHDQFRCDKLQLVIDKAAQRGTKTRPVNVKPARKGGDTSINGISEDIVTAYRWHCDQGYAGKRLVFCPNDVIPKFLDSHKAPLEIVIAKLGIRRLTHHKLGRHSVGSQADDIGATTKAIQRQLGHKSPASTAKYVHGSAKAQQAIVDGLRPVRPPHESIPQDELN